MTENTTADAAVATPNAARARGRHRGRRERQQQRPRYQREARERLEALQQEPPRQIQRGRRERRDHDDARRGGHCATPRAIARRREHGAGSVIVADERQRPDAELADAPSTGPNAPGDVAARPAWSVMM